MKGYDKIKKILSNQFEIDLFEASLLNLKESTNKLRYNNFAYSIRELSRHFLYSLSPEERLKKCEWYKTETPDDKPTRAQRVKYSIQGGINDEILTKWGLDVSDLESTIKAVVKTIVSLNKYTHINPDVFDISDEEIEKKSTLVLETFNSLVERIIFYRRHITTHLDGIIEEQIINSTIYNSFENIDCLAPHYSFDDSEVSTYHISEINENEIIVKVTGNVYVTLEYGSRKERREDDGLDIKRSFPFETNIMYEISEDFPLSYYEIDVYDVDTSNW